MENKSVDAEVCFDQFQCFDQAVCFLCARVGTTSQALIKEKPWLQAHLSTIASSIAIGVGVLMLLANMGLPVPFFS